VRRTPDLTNVFSALLAHREAVSWSRVSALMARRTNALRLGSAAAGLLVAVATVWWLSHPGLTAAERSWCRANAGDVAAWVLSSALREPFTNALDAERAAGHDPWSSDAPAIVDACKGSYSTFAGVGNPN
jgi:hypothetical protein